MKIIHHPSGLGVVHPRISLAIGVFDGVHLGHQHIIRQTLALARQHSALSVVVTFDRHPNSVVAPDRVPPLLYSRDQKIRSLEGLGPDVLWEIHFDRAFSLLSGDEFIREMVQSLGNIQSICVGADFVFGHKRSGNLALLSQLGLLHGFQVHGLDAVSLDGHTISSTRIRELVRNGDFAGASHMLGRPYSLAGRVVMGDQLGRQLGFPTANLDAVDRAIPPAGVYAGTTHFQGQTYAVAMNIGTRPTLQHSQPRLCVEAHLLDFQGQLYGEELEIQIRAKLREEKKFQSMQALKQQIGLDIAAVRTLAKEVQDGFLSP